MSKPVKSTLDNGIRVVSEFMPGVRSVTVGFWVGVGSRDEPVELGGTTHFLEHLLFKGTDKRTALEIAEEMDAVGGDLNAFTTKEFTCYYARTLDDDLPLALDILTDITCNPAFPEDEVDIERGVILEEIRAHEDDPADVAHELFYAALWPTHPLGRPILGQAETIATLPRADIADYFRDYYLPENMVISAAGNVEHENLLARVHEAFGAMSGGRAPRVHTPENEEVTVAITERSSEQAHLVYGMPALGHRDPDRYALTVMNHILGGSMSSRLFQEIREKRGLAYSVYSYRSLYDETGTFGVYAGTKPDQAHQVAELIISELSKIADSGVTIEELERAKGHVRGSLALSNEDSGSRMSRIGRGELVADELLTIDDLVGVVDAVTQDDIARVTGRVLGDSRRVLAVVGPFQEGAFDSVIM